MIHQPQQIQQTKRKHLRQFIVEQSVILVVVQYNIICIDDVNFFFLDKVQQTHEHQSQIELDELLKIN